MYLFWEKYQFSSAVCPRPIFVVLAATDIWRRFGLGSKFWYREVWKWQTKLTATSAAAALSISRRKNIFDSTIDYIEFSSLREELYDEFDTSRAAFFDRFASNSQHLKSLSISWPISVPPGYSSFAVCEAALPKVGSTLESLTLNIATQQFYCFLDTAWRSLLPSCQFRQSLTFLCIDLSSIYPEVLPVFAELLPNLQEARFPNLASTAAYNGFDSGSAISPLPARRPARFLIPSFFRSVYRLCSSTAESAIVIDQLPRLCVVPDPRKAKEPKSRQLERLRAAPA